MPVPDIPDPRLASKEAFLAQIAGTSHFDQLFGHLPGISFFAKNADLELQAANPAFWSRLGLASEADLIGKTDFELFPQRLAENFRRDDLVVMKRRKPMLDILELFFDTQGLPDWFLTNKFPIFDPFGEVIGVMGTVRSFAGERRARSSLAQLDRAVEFLRTNFCSEVRMSELATHCGMSVRQFNRRFREAFNTTPNAFLIKTRIHAACELLRDSEVPISMIAEQLGFYDQSSFTLHFRRHMGTTPLRYRRSLG
ncbi:MAG: AraC-like DNA-binding protein [Rhodothermales bacterium]|jgi:AraC-like DNA-binding protein